MTILDADWNASDDPFVKPAPSFATTPDGWFSSGTNLSFLTVEARNVLSGVLDDEDRQVVVLAHDTNGSIERGAAFHNTADRLDESTAQWHPYRERSRNDEGDPIWFDVLACSLIVNDAGDDTCYLDLSFSSFPNNEYRIRITRFPIYYDNDLAQLILSLGSFLLGDLPIWDESGLGTFYQGRDFLDKDSFQAYSDREFSHRLRFIAKRGESINSMIADMLGQTPSLAAIRPSDTDDGKTSLHVYHPEELPVRSDVVLSSDSQTVTPHVISWELRQGIVNPTTGYNVTFGTITSAATATA